MAKKGISEQLDHRFIARMEKSLGTESALFFSALETEPPTSVILNTEKDPGNHFTQARPMPWCSAGRYLEYRPDFTFDPLFHAGCYYVMEASSMFLSYVLSDILEKNTSIYALDLCAAPGGKSIIALSGLSDGSLLVCNEVNRSRFQALQYNMDKWGAPNVVRTSFDPSRIPWSGKFDLILVDAPCSGEGLFRKDKRARGEWSPSNVTHCSARQRRILAEADRLLAPGGTLLYSTCTFSEDENIRQVQWMADQFEYTTLGIDIPDAWNITRMTLGDHQGYQFYPHKVSGEGFFCAVMKKSMKPHPPEGQKKKFSERRNSEFTESPIPASLSDWIVPAYGFGELTILQTPHGARYLLQSAGNYDWLRSVPGITPGTEIGETKDGIFTPAYALALSQCLNPNVPSIELDKNQAITYLRREQVEAHCDMPGWHVARYEGFALGWLKQTQAGLKNYFPSRFRIIKQQSENGGDSTQS